MTTRIRSYNRILTQKQHVVNLVFPIALFFVFAISALLVLLLAANLYHKNTDTVLQDDDRYAVLSYLSEKVIQNDVDGGISITTRDGVDCLTIASYYNETAYVTYIYEYEGMLKELFIRADADISFANGSDITACYGLQMEETTPGVFTFTAADRSGCTSSLTAAERSAQ